jgi:hypothetical protein
MSDQLIATKRMYPRAHSKYVPCRYLLSLTNIALNVKTIAQALKPKMGYNHT